MALTCVIQFKGLPLRTHRAGRTAILLLLDREALIVAPPGERLHHCNTLCNVQDVAFVCASK